MKTMIQKPRVLAGVLIIVYLFGLLVGLTAIGIYPVFRKQKPGLLADGRTIVQTHLLEGSEDSILFLRSSTTRVLIYDGSGNRLRFIGPNKPNNGETYDVIPNKYLSDVLSGEEVFHVIPAQLAQPRLTRIWLVAGVPIAEEGKVIGAVFLIKNLENLQEAVLGYFVFFTILYWLSAYFMILFIRKKLHLEMLQQTYIANVTHALKTPNSSIKALAETLCDGMQPDPDKQGVYFGMILREASKQEHMIQDILALSRIQSNRVDFTKTYVDAKVIFDQIRQRYAAICECAGISLDISDDILALPMLYTNEASLLRLLALLIDNALKFVDEGGQIRIDVSVSKHQATFCVRDNGVGIKAEDLPHIFERFYKDNSKRNESGSGLGLAIAREIAANLKEKIWAESEFGKGAAFFFTVRF